MDSSNSGSFIPKRNINKPVARVGRRVYIFSYVAYVIFFGTLMFVVGVFIINLQAEKKLNEFIASIEEAQSLFRQDQIDSLLALEAQLNSASTLLDRHASPLRIFYELEQNVLQDVQLSSFVYTREVPTEAFLTIEAQSLDFDEALVQRETLQRSMILGNLDVTEVVYGEPSEGSSGDGGSPASSVGGLDLVKFKIEGAIPITNIAYQTAQIAPSSIPEPTTTDSFTNDNNDSETITQ
jgi:hypothetical protein